MLCRNRKRKDCNYYFLSLHPANNYKQFLTNVHRYIFNHFESVSSVLNRRWYLPSILHRLFSPENITNVYLYLFHSAQTNAVFSHCKTVPRINTRVLKRPQSSSSQRPLLYGLRNVSAFARFPPHPIEYKESPTLSQMTTVYLRNFQNILHRQTATIDRNETYE